MKLCNRCNGENEDNNSVCTHCGASFDEVEELTSESPETTENLESPEILESQNLMFENPVNQNNPNPSFSQSWQNSNESYNNVPVKTNAFAISSLVLGIVSVPLICCCYIGIIPGILAVIFGFIAKKQIGSSAGKEKGDGMALAGLILGFCTIGFVILFIILSVAHVFSSQDFMDEFRRQLERSKGGNL